MDEPSETEERDPFYSVGNWIVSGLAGACTCAVTVAIIKNVCPDAVNKREQIKFAVGSYVIGSMVAAQASKYTSAKIDEFVDDVKKLTALFSKKETPVPETPEPVVPTQAEGP